MKNNLIFMIFCVLVGLSTIQAQATLIDIVDVSAPAINCIYDNDCTIVVTDTSDHFTLNGTSGDAFLQSRTWPVGEAGTAAEGLYGYKYRIDLRNLIGILNIPCITSFTINFDSLVALDYDGNGDLDDMYVVTQGGLGTVAPAVADKVSNTITFQFDPPVYRDMWAARRVPCPGWDSISKVPSRDRSRSHIPASPIREPLPGEEIHR